MSQAHEAAFPFNGEIEDKGLTKREIMAAMAMQGWIASFAGINEIPNPEKTAIKAVAFADALLAELEK